MRYCQLFCLTILLLLLSIGLHAQVTKNSPEDSITLENLLNPDGTLNTSTGYRGSINPKGWNMKTGPNGEPRFVRDISSTNTVPEDSLWADQFALGQLSGDVYAIASLGDTLYVGGYFKVTGNNITNNITFWDGIQWLPLTSGTNESVSAIAVSGSNVYVGGYFTTAGGVTVNHIAKWNGSSWSNLGTGTNGSVSAIVVSGSNVYVGGNFTTAGGVTVNNIAKWNGSSWSGLGAGTNGYVSAIVVSGSNVYVGGNFTTAGGVTVNNIAQWNGSSWSNLGTGTNATVEAVAVNGLDVFVGGYFTTAGGVTVNHIAKWNGSSWSGLGTGTNDPGRVYAIAVSGSNVYVGGYFTTAGGVTVNHIAKWNGSSWSGLSTGTFGGPVFAIEVDISNVYVGGSFRKAGTILAYGFAKWDSVKWECLSSEGVFNGLEGDITSIAVSDNSLYVGGYFTTAGGLTVNNIAKWNGNSWSNLGTGTNGSVSAIVVSGSNVYVGGYFTTAGGVTVNHIAKWNGSSWSSLGTGTNGPVYAITVSGSNVYVGGSFTTAGGVTVNGIAKWDGISWLSLGSGTDGSVSAIAVSGNEVYIGGSFVKAGGITVNNVAKWDGSGWSALGNGTNERVSTLALSGSELFVGGHFTTSGGVPTNYVAKWENGDWMGLGSGFRDLPPGSEGELCVNSIVTWGQNIYAAGFFVSAGDLVVNNISLWDGVKWNFLGTGIDPGLYYNIRNLAVQRGSIYAVGLFELAGGKPSHNLARWSDRNVTGFVFDDLNANSIREPGDTALSGWIIILSDSIGRFIKNTYSDSNGYYSFSNLPLGKYRVSEVQQTDWFLTYPKGSGVHEVEVGGDLPTSGINFGNTYGYRYTGPTNGFWSVDTNWLGDHTPTANDIAIITPNKKVIVDSLPSDTIKALQLKQGSTLTFNNDVGRLKVAGAVRIDNNASILFSSSDPSSGMICYSDFVNSGTINPGISTISYAGTRHKLIINTDPVHSPYRNTFYNIQIIGDSTESIGNVRIKNQLSLDDDLIVRDSIFIDSSYVSSMLGSGKIPSGTVIRSINPYSTSIYRFESDSTYVKFKGTGTYPLSVKMSAYPGIDPTSFSMTINWEEVPCTVDTLKNIIKAESVRPKSKWAIGVPRLRSKTKYSMSNNSFVQRVYSLEEVGSADALATLAFRYDQSEIPPGDAENTLTLYTLNDCILMQAGWNLISLPVAVPDNRIVTLFPTAIGDAFKYSSSLGYVSVDRLESGIGYWLKFPSAACVDLGGVEIMSDTIELEEGWNLIGSLSMPIYVNNLITQPTGIIDGSIFSYNGSYNIVDSLLPLQGYWVKCTDAGVIIMDTSIHLSITKGSVAWQDLDKNSKLVFTDASGNSQTLYVSTSDNNQGLYELPPIPPEGVFDVRFSSGKYLESLPEGKNIEYPIIVQSSNHPITVKWYSNGFGISPKLKIGGNEVVLENERELKINSKDDKISLEYSIKNDVPQKYSLEQNIPNPFNPMTMIKYQLPQDSRVVLKIFNTLGQLVTTLMDDVESAGYKSVEWDAPGVASGVYFYRLEATSVLEPSRTFTQVKKMVSLK